MMTRGAVAFVVLAALVPASASAQRPSIRVGAVRLDLTARIQADVHEPWSVGNDDDVDVDLARRRAGVKGSVARQVEFEVEHQIARDGKWGDAFVNVRTFRAAQFRAGRFKMPFSRERLTSASDLDFIYRSRGADLLAPGRSTGVAVHGRLARKTLGYEAGVFAHDGDAARFGSNPGAGTTAAARLTVKPLGSRAKGSPANLDIGFSATSGNVPEGRNSLRGRMTTRTSFFSPVYVNGPRTRLGADLEWKPGPFTVTAEVLRVDDTRRGQGLFGETLPTLRGQGWSVAGVWHRRRLELTARAERLSFGSTLRADAEIWTPRAAQFAPISDNVWTVGANWSLHRFARIQVNAIHERDADWTPVLRVQFAM